MKPKAASYYKQNRLKQLRAFCHTAQSGSISKAATTLYLSQPSVSLQIQALERELNTILFERRGPKISLTPDGKELLDIALPMVESMDSLRDTFAARSGDLNSGYVNIAAGESTILYMLPNTIRTFSKNYPGVRIRLHNVTGVDGLAMLRSDDADFAVGSMFEIPDDINYFPICRYTPTLITPLDHPLVGKQRVTLEEIARYNLILPPRHLSTWNIVITAFQRRNIKHNVTLETGGWEVIKRYVEMGIGISIVTDICLAKRDRLSVIPVGEHFASRNYGLILRRGKFISAQASRFIEILSPEFFQRSGHVQDLAAFRGVHDHH